MASNTGYNVGPSREFPDRDIIVQKRKGSAGWMMYHAPADGNTFRATLYHDTTRENYPDKRSAVARAESLVSSVGARWNA